MCLNGMYIATNDVHIAANESHACIPHFGWMGMGYTVAARVTKTLFDETRTVNHILVVMPTLH